MIFDSPGNYEGLATPLCIATETLYTNVMPLVGSVSYNNKKQGAKLTYVAMLAGHVNQGVKIITKTHMIQLKQLILLENLQNPSYSTFNIHPDYKFI